MIERRLSDPVLAQRQVSIEFKQTNERLDWTIQDEGEGFDWVAVPNPLESEEQERLNGRGIFLARFQFDTLEYIGNGNKVRMTRKISGPINTTSDPEKIAV